jgi:hypothetical protein
LQSFCLSHSFFILLRHQTIGDISSGRFGSSDNLENLSSLNAEVSSNRIRFLDSRKLRFFQLVTPEIVTGCSRKVHLLEKLFLFVICQNRMSWNQLVLGQIDHQFLFVKRLKSVFRRHIIQCLFRLKFLSGKHDILQLTTRSHTLLYDDQRSRNIFFLHSLAVNLDLLDGHLNTDALRTDIQVSYLP